MAAVGSVLVGGEMTTRVVKSKTDLEALHKVLDLQKRPFTVDIVKGKHRSVEQNRLQRLWCNEIAEQLGDQTPEDVRAYCKAYFGVPILLAENTHFAEEYEKHVKPLPYEQKLALMREPLDLPVTRLMTVDQKSRYLNEIHRYFSERGVVLTDPEQIGRAA